ncbi:hypothetical protein BG000_002154, partial [Podila horticola]
SAIEQEIMQKNRQPPSHSFTSENYQKRTDAYPSSDLEPMDEFQLVRQHAKAQVTSFSTLGKQRANMKDWKKQRRKQIRRKGKKGNRKLKRGSDPSKTPEPGHVRPSFRVKANAKGAQWTAQVDQVGKGKEGPDGKIKEAEAQDEGDRLNTMATMHPAIDRDPICVRHCRATFACGTPTAPVYSGLDQFLANLGKGDNEQVNDSQTKDVSSGSPGTSRNVLVVGSVVLASLASLSLFV